MPSNYCRICTCVRTGGKSTNNGYANAIIPELSAEATAKLGQAFGLVTAEADAKSGSALSALLEDAIARAAEEVSTKSLGETRDAMVEHLVAKVNSAMEPVFSERGLPIDRSTVSAIMAFVDGRTLFTVLWGYPHALLLRNPSGSDAATFDLVAEGRAGEQAPAARDRFAEIVSGPLSNKDRVVLSSHDLLDSLSREKLLSTIGANRGDAAANGIADLLMAYAGVESAAIVVAGEPAYASGPIGAAPPPKTSMDNLFGTASRTNDILSPSIFRLMAQRVGSMVGGSKSGKVEGGQDRSKEQRAEKQAMRDDTRDERDDDDDDTFEDEQDFRRPNKKANAGPSLVSTALAASGRAAKRAAAAIGHSAKAITDRERRTATLTAFKGEHASYTDATIAKWNGLPRKKKLLVMMVLSVIVVANGFGLVAMVNGAKLKKIAAYEDSVTTIRQKIDTAESSLIYNDYGRAKILLDEAQALINDLPIKTADQQRTKNNLVTNLDQQRQAMRREVPLTSPTVVATVTEGAAHLGKIAIYKTKLWVTAVDGSIYSMGTKDKELIKAEANLAAAPSWITPTASNGLIAGDATGKTVRITDAGKGLAVTLGSVPDLAITDAEVYSSSIYVLDAAHNRILKFAILDKDYGKGALTIKDGTDVSAGRTMAIDGSIFVINADATSRKLTKGARDPFVLQDAEPKAKNVIASQIGEATDALYVLEPGRLLKYSRTTGRFINQYTSEVLNEATDFLVDEKAKTVTVVAGAKLLRFVMP